MYRYIGNKTKLLPHITNRISEMIGDTGTVADIMAGTGSVALELKKNGYTVGIRCNDLFISPSGNKPPIKRRTSF